MANFSWKSKQKQLRHVNRIEALENHNRTQPKTLNVLPLNNHPSNLLLSKSNLPPQEAQTAEEVTRGFVNCFPSTGMNQETKRKCDLPPVPELSINSVHMDSGDCVDKKITSEKPESPIMKRSSTSSASCSSIASSSNLRTIDIQLENINRDCYRKLLSTYGYQTPTSSTSNEINHKQVIFGRRATLENSTEFPRNSSFNPQGLSQHSGIHLHNSQDFTKESLSKIYSSHLTSTVNQSSVSKVESKPLVKPYLSQFSSSSIREKLLSKSSLEAEPTSEKDTSEFVEELVSVPQSSHTFKEEALKATCLNDDFICSLKSLNLRERDREEETAEEAKKVIAYRKKREEFLQNRTYVQSNVSELRFTPYQPFDYQEEEEEVEDLSAEFPALEEYDDEIDAALVPTPENEILSEAFSITIKRKDMETLKGLNWLNDEVRLLFPI